MLIAPFTKVSGGMIPDEIRVLLQSKLCILAAHPLAGLEGEDATQTGLTDDLGLPSFQRARNGIGRLQDIKKGGHAAVDHLDTGPAGGDLRQLRSDPVLDVGPPEVVQEAGELGHHRIGADAAGEYIIHMVVPVDETGQDDLVVASITVSCAERSGSRWAPLLQ